MFTAWRRMCLSARWPAVRLSVAHVSLSKVAHLLSLPVCCAVCFLVATNLLFTYLCYQHHTIPTLHEQQKPIH